MTKKYAFLPGKVENWIFIINYGNMSFFDLPIKNLGSIIQMMQLNYGGSLEKMFMLNPSISLSTSWSVVEKFIDSNSAAKI